MVRLDERSVIIPIIAEKTEMTITATGKAVTAPPQVNKSHASLVGGDNTDSGSSTPWIWGTLGAITMVAGGVYFTRTRKGEVTAAKSLGHRPRWDHVAPGE